MNLGLEIFAIGPYDSDCFRMEMRAFNGRDNHRGSHAVFPKTPDDVRAYELGIPGMKNTAGYCGITMRCSNPAGHARLAIIMEDSTVHYASARAEFGLSFEASSLDEFVEQLRSVDREREGSALLGCDAES
jgi:hypothetical protein